MNILIIVKEYLKNNGFDGLYQPAECSCQLSDLMPCDNAYTDCVPGYKTECPEGGEFDFVIGKDKNANCDDYY